MSILVFYNDLDGISNNYNVILSNNQNKLNGWNLKDWWVEWVASWSKAQFIHCSLIPSVSKKLEREYIIFANECNCTLDFKRLTA